MAACRGLLSAALLAGVMGCSASVEPGVSVEVVASGASLEPSAIFQNDLGYEVRVDGAWLTNSEFEIEECASPLARLWDVLVPSAYAHGTESPTRLAEPVVQALLSGEDTPLGQLTPPAGDYCVAHYTVGPADDDAVGLEDAPDLEGRSVLLRGTYRLPDEDWQTFEVTSEASFEVEVDTLELTLNATRRSAVLQIDGDPADWLGGLDFAAQTEAELSEVLLQNVQASISVHER